MRKSLLYVSLAVAATLMPVGSAFAQAPAKKVLPTIAPSGGLSGKGLIPRSTGIPNASLPISNGRVFTPHKAQAPRRVNPIEPDVTLTFETEADWNLFSTLDGNGDGTTWYYGTNNKAARSPFSNTSNDDWLFSPPIHLTSGHSYSVAFRIRNADASYPNSIEVKWGNGTDAESMTNTLLETSVPSASWTWYTYDVTPTADGNYYLGFHDNTVDGPNGWCILLDSVTVKKGLNASAPSGVTDFTVTPGERGALSATISLKAPTTDVGGNAIEKVDSIQLSRDGELLTTFKDVAAGTALTYNDNSVPASGIHKYAAVPYIGSENGTRAEANVRIGEDVPTYPKNIILNDNETNVIANWDAASEEGANGGYVNPANVAVSFFNIIQTAYGVNLGDSVTSSAKGATTVAIPQNPDETTSYDGTTQALYQLAARADGDGGQSDYTLTGGLVVGPAITAPFKESFKNGSIDNGFAWLQGNDQYAQNDEAAGWYIDNTNSADGDGGCAMWSAYSQESWYGTVDYTITQGDEVSINSPKINLKGATNPKLYFSLYATANDPAKLRILIQTPDGVDHEAKTFDLSETTADGWTTQNVDLSQYVSDRYIMVKFHGVSTGDGTTIGVDNVNVFDQLEYNLKASEITVPQSVTAGKSGKADVKVENYGANDATGYSVVLYANDEAVDTVTVNDNLPVLASNTVSLEFPVAINQTEPVNVKATVVYANDLDDEDNTTETKQVEVNASKYASVSTLSADPVQEGVNLTWTAPDASEPQQVTEDFESYDAFATQFGDWTLVDGDDGYAAPIFNSLTYPGQGTQFAFDIFNPNALSDQADVVGNNPGLAPHSGNQYAAAIYKTDASQQSLVDADNWLISPELTGHKQTITFYVMNIAGQSFAYNEKFDVLYSTESTDTADFVKIESDVADGTTFLGDGANWKEINVELPEGAKYFAIHNNSTIDQDFFLFGIDDITFEKIATGANDSVIAYNIYRDGKLVGSVKGNVLTYLDNDADAGVHIYNITVVYQSKNGDVNESGFSNDASITVTGIDGVSVNADGKYNVYTIDGKTIMIGAKSLNGLKPGLYIINDKKYIIKN